MATVVSTHSSAQPGKTATPATYEGKCFCGAVEIEVTGEPVAAGYCHCESCRSWSASPVNAFSLWKPDAVKVTKGEGNIGVYHKTEKSYRKFCNVCGGLGSLVALAEKRLEGTGRKLTQRERLTYLGER